MAKEVFFFCSACKVELTEFLRQLPEISLRFEAGAEAVKKGHFIELSAPFAYRDFITGRKSGHKYFGTDGDLIAFEDGDYLLNIKDVRHQVAADASYGCCGLQPRSEFNARCPNGHAIGTIHADCWGASVFRLGVERVEAIAA